MLPLGGANTGDCAAFLDNFFLISPGNVHKFNNGSRPMKMQTVVVLRNFIHTQRVKWQVFSDRGMY